ncbi:MAG: divalent-cation tolerance protein CutA [Rubrivivax sp.]|nr:divalent-cation tolerance protein CutA [Rubrivivax sp.]
MKLCLLSTTVAKGDDARRMAQAAVEHRLAACVHIEAIDAVYRWQGAIRHDDEQRLTFKTTEAAVPALKELLLGMHPYEVPALYVVPVSEATHAYHEWVMGEVAG